MAEFIFRKITMKKQGKIYHRFYDRRGNTLNDTKYIESVCSSIYIPPAYDNVKIYTNPSRKIRAIGYDTKLRPQYIYNKDYIQKKSEQKFNHMAVFGKRVPSILRKINEDLSTVKDTKDKQIALIVKLIMDCHFRVGSEKYLKDNHSYGTTTLENKHVRINKNSVTIEFIGKKKVKNHCVIHNKKMVKTLKQKKRTTRKNDKLFTYRRGETYHNVKSQDVNQYLKQFGDFTTKNFRTWGANIEFIIQLLKHSKRCSTDTKAQIKKNVNESIKQVAHKLHNTPGVCRSNYLDPELIQFYTNDCLGFLTYFFKQNQSYTKDNISKQYVYFLS